MPTLRDRLRGISAKFYLLAALAIAAVSGLAGASIYFAKTTELAAHHLYSDGFLGVVNSTRLELLLEQHRRIVESMPAEVDRGRLRDSRNQLELIGRKLSALIGDLLAEKNDGLTDAVERRIAHSFPALFRSGEQVAFYAYDFAQDKALEFAEEYARAANETERLIQDYRKQRLNDAQTSVADMLSTAGSLTIWVLICTLAAYVLIGPIGLAIAHRASSRLGKVTGAMVKLAAHDTSITVPSRQDTDEIGGIARAVEVFKDNAIKLMAREIELAQVNRRLDVALNNMTHGLCMFDVERRLIVCNESYIRMYRLPRELANPGTSLQHIEDRRVTLGNAALSTPEQITAETPGPAMQEPSAFTHELMDGRVIAISQQRMPDGGWVAVHEDITERRRAEAKVAHLARHDLLTNLPNRVLFREQLDDAFSLLKRGQTFAVLCLDLDHFKEVNDTLGHPVGDELLKAVARRLRACVGEADVVARIGGDEFAVVQAVVESPEHCSRLAARIVAAVREPYDIDGKHVVIGTSVGIALAPNDGSDPDQLLKNSDMALYLAKGDGRGTHRFFEAEMDKRLQARRSLELDLRAAVTNGEFELYYQPIIRLETNKISGFEALLRWNHPTQGRIPPDIFIPLAEETGLILPLGEWVLRTACNHAAKWPVPVNVAVNLSPAQFKGQNLIQIAMNALAASGLSPQRLELEITESVFLQNEAGILSTLHMLREIGVRISMDDFGTGYSSLAYLRRFPFDKIKIDRSFVHDMLHREDCKAIVGAVAGLARKLKMTTVVEGVETQAQLDLVRAELCDECQGYLFGRPAPESEAVKLLSKAVCFASAA